MSKFRYGLTLALALGAVSVAGPAAQAQPYPAADRLAQMVIQRYETETCQQIAASRSAPRTEGELKAITLLRNNPQIRTYFLNQVAAAIANKLFECGMIP